MVMPLVVAPHPELAPWIYHILVMPLDGCLSRLPSALSPGLLLFARGGAAQPLADGSCRAVPRASLTGPYLDPRESRAAPGSVFLSVMFRPGVMAEALGPGVGELRDRIVPLDEVLPPLLVRQMLETVDASDSPADWVAAVQGLLRRCLRPRRDPARLADLLGASTHLFSPAGQIAAHLGIGLRQLERRVAHGYGANLRELRRVARFGFSLARLQAQPPRRGELTRIAQDFGYYDQAHMDRDYRDMAGASPGELLRAVADGAPGYWWYRLGQRDFRDLFLPDDVDSVQAGLFSPA
ncbi:helix-turn-helix domain-containing protein [Azospira oryzae]|uniref:helix-turn-helix domain-containing protein n=1 Tax=Azospira oryzae TaxID=146939 RepID=UPI001963B5B5|nr:helix-turn-helix domain-containing protein [Azospira oryzae]